MTIKTFGTLGLMLGPAAVLYLAGWSEAAHYLALGSVLAFQLSLLARPVAAFSMLLPAVYAAAAITAQSTDGVVALIVAIAAAVGAASSQGLHRGLIALLAAALLGSFEPAAGATVLQRSGFLLAGSTYGFLLSITVLRGVALEGRPVNPQAAIGYAAMVAALALLAWFAARMAGFAHAWWLPLGVVAVCEPVQAGPARNALLRVAAALCATLLLVAVADGFNAPWVRAVLLILALALALAVARRQDWMLAVLVTPVLVLLSHHGALHEAPLDYLLSSLPAFLPVLAFAGLGQWLLWILRPDPGRAVA
jgi:hypothetical protein